MNQERILGKWRRDVDEQETVFGISTFDFDDEGDQLESDFPGTSWWKVVRSFGGERKTRDEKSAIKCFSVRNNEEEVVG